MNFSFLIYKKGVIDFTPKQIKIGSRALTRSNDPGSWKGKRTNILDPLVLCFGEGCVRSGV
jgi:hypothetical protein